MSQKKKKTFSLSHNIRVLQIILDNLHLLTGVLKYQGEHKARGKEQTSKMVPYSLPKISQKGQNRMIKIKMQS